MIMGLFNRFQIPPPAPDRTAEVLAVQEQLRELIPKIREELEHLNETLDEEELRRTKEEGPDHD